MGALVTGVWAAVGIGAIGTRGGRVGVEECQRDEFEGRAYQRVRHGSGVIVRT